MKRNIVICILLCAVAIIGIAAFLHWNNRDMFRGDSVRTEDCYSLQMDLMNKDDSHVLTLEAGDVLSVEYSIEKGRVDLLIGIDDENLIYKGNDISEGSFELIVPEDGDYLISVQAKHAAGRLEIEKQRSEAE